MSADRYAAPACQVRLLYKRQHFPYGSYGAVYAQDSLTCVHQDGAHMAAVEAAYVQN